MLHSSNRRSVLCAATESQSACSNIDFLYCAFLIFDAVCRTFHKTDVGMTKPDLGIIMSSYFPGCDQIVRKNMHKDMKNSVAIAKTLLFAVLVFIIPTEQLGAQQQGVQLGVAVPSSSTLNQFETSIGRGVDAVRRYRRWEHRFPSTHDINLLNGRDLILSIWPCLLYTSPSPRD